MILKWTIGIVAFISIGYGVVILVRQDQQSRPGETIVTQGRDHITIGESHPEYNSNPPTSGWHYAESAAWGVYQDELPDEQIIHNLEHGGVWISYVGIDDSTKFALEEIARSQSKVIIEPRAKNDAPIVLASWGRLLKLQEFDEQTIMNFIEANRNRAPESRAQ